MNANINIKYTKNSYDKENCWKKFGGHILEKNGGLGGIGKKSKIEKKSLVFTPWCSIPYQIAHPWCSFRKNFELSGKKRVFGPSFAGTALKFLMGIATVSESMHKEVGRVQAKISGTPSQWFRVTHHWSSLMLILLVFSHPWCSLWKKSWFPVQKIRLLPQSYWYGFEIFTGHSHTTWEQAPRVWEDYSKDFRGLSVKGLEPIQHY